jgi:glycosyltransferase involved in cell wall biosynthesis
VRSATLIRVGFRQLRWTGGNTYLYNLLFAVTTLAERHVQPVVLLDSARDPVATAAATDFGRLAGVELFATPGLVGSERALLFAGRVLKRTLQRDFVQEHWMRRAGIELLSHTTPLGRHFPRPWLYWIGDLQHRALPDYFSRGERRNRDAAFAEGARDATRIIVSSRAALADLVAFVGPGVLDKCRVLNFVSQPRIAASAIAGLEALVARYPIPRRYFHLPNQFWKHKNHAIVVEALKLAAVDEPELTVVATGPDDDYRHPGHYRQLMGRVAALGLGARFLHVGMVPFADLMALMKHAVAVINPSRFEGWSTTVEEAKSLGKRLILSDLAVHREQAPARGQYFDPDDTPALAQLLVDAWRHVDDAADARAAAAAEAELPARTAAFGHAYQDIVREAMTFSGTRSW